MFDPHTDNVFAEAVRSELERAKRSRSEISIVLVQLDERARRRAQRIEDRARARLRDSDAVGLYNQSHLAFLLTDTQIDGARKVLGRLRGRYGMPEALDQYHIIGYPEIENLENAST